MRSTKTFLVTVVLLAAVALSASAIAPEKPPKRNLKVLPKDISDEDLDKIMDNYNVALGVKCNFCHAPRQDDPGKLDFRSDAKPEKNITRSMMRMTNMINKKYFEYEKNKGSEQVLAVNCNTCHRGHPHPEE